MHICVIIPTYNERGTIKELVKLIFELGIADLEIIVVDDNSTDGTIEVARALKKRYPITLLSRPKKMGLGSALRDGLMLARLHGAIIAVTMDADLSHNPSVIIDMLGEIDQGADLVVGSRRVPGGIILGWGTKRALMSRAAMELARRMLGLKTRDVTSGFRAYRRRVLEELDLMHLASTGYAFQEELLYRVERAGLRVVETPIIFQDRRQGKSKLGIRDILEFFGTIIRLRFAQKS